MASKSASEAVYKAIENRTSEAFHTDRSTYRSLPVDAVAHIGETFGIDGKTIERMALERQIVPERYARNRKTLAFSDQIRLLDSAVCVVGLGGLGGQVAEMLARMGIGALRLIDGDRFEESNLNRQLFCTEASVSDPKATCAARRITEVNSSVSVTARAAYVDGSNGVDFLENVDVVVDCLDDITVRFILEQGARHHDVPLVSAAVAGTSGHVTTIYPGDEGLKLIYGEPAQAVKKGAEAALGCSVYAVTPSAAPQCAAVFKIITRKGKTLQNRMMVFDLTDNTVEYLTLV